MATHVEEVYSEREQKDDGESDEPTFAFDTWGRHDASQPVDPDTGEVSEGSTRLQRGDREEHTGNVQVISWLAEA